MSEKFKMPSAEQANTKPEAFDKQKMLTELGEMIADLHAIKDIGGEKRKTLIRSHGYVDGYMKALIDTGVCTPQELRELADKQKEEFEKKDSQKRKD